MPSNYPSSLDSFTNPMSTDPMNSNTVAHAALHTKINDILASIQKELGVNPRGSSESVAARLGTFALTSHTHTTAQVTGLDAALAARGTGLATAAGVALAPSGAVGTSTLTARQDHVHPLPTLTALGAAASSHTHAVSDVTGLQSALDGKTSTSTLVNAGAGLSGGGALGSSVTLSVNFAGNGSATTSSRSDHNHDSVYAGINHNHDAAYVKRTSVGTVDAGAQAAPPVVVEASSSSNTSGPSTAVTGLPVGTIAAIYS